MGGKGKPIKSGKAHQKVGFFESILIEHKN